MRNVLGIVSILLTIIVFCPVVQAQDLLTLPFSSMRLVSGSGLDFTILSSQYYHENPVWEFKLEKLSEINKFELPRKNLTDIEPVQFNYNYKIKPSLRLSLDLAMTDRSGYHLFVSKPGESISETGMDELLDPNHVAMSIGVDWRFKEYQGVYIGYLYGAKPLDKISGRLDPEQNPRQSIDLAYGYYVDKFYFNLGYIMTLNPQTDFSSAVSGGRNLIDESAVYMRLQLKF